MMVIPASSVFDPGVGDGASVIAPISPQDGDARWRAS